MLFYYQPLNFRNIYKYVKYCVETTANKGKGHSKLSIWKFKEVFGLGVVFTVCEYRKLDRNSHSS